MSAELEKEKTKKKEKEYIKTRQKKCVYFVQDSEKLIISVWAILSG